MTIKSVLLIGTTVAVAAVTLYGIYSILSITDEEALARYDAAIAETLADPNYASSSFLQGYVEGLKEARAELAAKIAAKTNVAAQGA
jgi:hypothetical protein